MRFQEQVALITAGANGIGRATAEIIAREGGIVVVVDNNKEQLDRTVAEVGDAGGSVHSRLCNAVDPADVDSTVASIAQEFGKIDILVNGVGGSTVVSKPNAQIDEQTFADWQKLIDFNLSGTFLFTHAVVPIMKRQRSGKIVNIGSSAGRGVSIGSSGAYAAAKGGIVAFTRKLSYELGPSGITINTVAPNKTLTERMRPRWEQQSPEEKQSEIERIPLGRIAEAADPAKVICFLASSDADFVTGVTIDVTGGL